MSRVVVLGAGIAGHTAAAFLRRWLGRDDHVIVVSPKPTYNWIPSNIWVGVGVMTARDVVLPLAPVYRRHGIEFTQARAVELHPEGRADDATPYVVVESTQPGRNGEREEIRYDFLINATGPKLNFAATPGLGPDGHSLSVCTETHAADTSRALDESVERMRRGERQRFLVGTGHGSCTCEGAAFEYIVNLEFELRARGVRDRADIHWITNEYELGDFGMGGMHVKHGGYVTPGRIFMESLFAERGIRWTTRAHVRQVAPGVAHYETIDGPERELGFDFAMLLPPFSGVGLTAIDGLGQDVTARVFPPQRIHDGRRRLRAASVRTVAGPGLAAHVSIPGLPQPVRRRHRVRAAARHLPPVSDALGGASRTGASAHRDAVGHDRQGRRAQRGRHAGRIGDADPPGLDGADGRRLCRIGRRQSPDRHGRIPHGVPGRTGLRALPDLRAGSGPDLG